MINSDATAKKRVKGVGQMVAGVTVAAAGVPMIILPGPGAAAIAGGAILMARGFENATGKKPPVDVDAAVFTASGKMREITDEHVMPAVAPTIATASSAAVKGVAAMGSATARSLTAASEAVIQGSKVIDRIARKMKQSGL